MERERFVSEGKLEVGPKEKFFAMLDGEYLGQLLLDRFGGAKEPGYTDLGRVRVTMERLEEVNG